MLIYAHRGSSGRLPENTLAAFRGAVDDGADGVEFDVRATADGVPVVLHDRELSRTTNGEGPVDGMSLSTLRRLRTGGGEQVPTLDEVFDLVAGKLRLDVEIKQPEIERAVLGALARHPTAAWAVSSFDWSVLRLTRRLDAGAVLWPLAETVNDALLAVAVEVAAPVVAVAASACTERTVALVQDAGLGVMAWTVNDEATARRLRDLGVFALCTDEPAAIRWALAAT